MIHVRFLSYQMRMAITIGSAGIALLMVLAPYDLQLLQWMAAHQLPAFMNFMSDSIFEFEMIGGGDLVVAYSLVTLVLYIFSSSLELGHRSAVCRKINQWLLPWPSATDWLRRYRLHLEFMVVSSFCCSTLMVKTLKWIMARPRPKKILWGVRPFNDWYEVGPYFLDEGLYRASFPSGHTASAVSIIGLAYVFAYCSRGEKYRLAGRLLMAGAILFGVTMAAARVMSTAHWPTDVLFSIFGGWLLIHVLFFYGYGFSGPHMTPGIQVGEYAETVPLRGIAICWYVTLMCLAAVVCFIGGRHFLFDRWPWLGLSCVPALALFVYSINKVRKTGLFAK